MVAEVTRVAGERGRGASALYGYGYADFAALLGVKEWRIAAAVFHRRLEPLSFLELTFARRHGLTKLEGLEESDAKVYRALRAHRPAVVRESVRARVSERPRPYGLGDLWAICHGDIATQIWADDQEVWNSQKLGHFRIDALESVLDYVEARLPQKQATRLGLGE